MEVTFITSATAIPHVWLLVLTLFQACIAVCAAASWEPENSADGLNSLHAAAYSSIPDKVQFLSCMWLGKSYTEEEENIYIKMPVCHMQCTINSLQCTMF